MVPSQRQVLRWTHIKKTGYSSPKSHKNGVSNVITMAAREAKNRFDYLMDQVQREPVTIKMMQGFVVTNNGGLVE